MQQGVLLLLLFVLVLTSSGFNTGCRNAIKRAQVKPNTCNFFLQCEHDYVGSTSHKWQQSTQKHKSGYGSQSALFGSRSSSKYMMIERTPQNVFRMAQKRIIKQFSALSLLVYTKWRTLRKFIRARTEANTCYVLKCEHNKFYVGSTSHKRQRMREHKTARGGSKWTKMHKPISVIHEIKRVSSKNILGLEASMTAQLMLKYGINNVRGAMFAEPREYDQSDIQALTGFIGHFNSMDYNDVRDQLEEILPPAISISASTPLKVDGDLVYSDLVAVPATVSTRWAKKGKGRKKINSNSNSNRGGYQRDLECFECGELGHFARDCPNKINSNSNRGGYQRDLECFECGELGHFARDCPNK